jgi:hypothetical protein
MGGLDGSLVHPQLIPAQTSKKVIRCHCRSRDVLSSTGVGVSGRANPSNSSQCSQEIPPNLFPFSVGGYLVNEPTAASLVPGLASYRPQWALWPH